MANRFIKATLAFLGDLIQGKDRRAIDGLTKAVGQAEAARIAKQAGMKSRFLPPGEKREERETERKQRQPGEDGDLIFVQSSNVHSFSWYRDSQTLQVRFLGGDSSKRAGPGPLYSYFGVSERIFQKFKASAATSAGGAVWDELRIRGSAFGHRFDYALAGAGAGGDVPRKQTGFGLNPREIKQGGKVYKSNKPGTGQFQ